MTLVATFTCLSILRHSKPSSRTTIIHNMLIQYPSALLAQTQPLFPHLVHLRRLTLHHDIGRHPGPTSMSLKSTSSCHKRTFLYVILFSGGLDVERSSQ